MTKQVRMSKNSTKTQKKTKKNTTGTVFAKSSTKWPVINRVITCRGYNPNYPFYKATNRGP